MWQRVGPGIGIGLGIGPGIAVAIGVGHAVVPPWSGKREERSFWHLGEDSNL